MHDRMAFNPAGLPRCAVYSRGIGVRTPNNIVRSPVRPATLWMRVVSRASVSVIAGRRVGSRRAHVDLSAPDGQRNKRLCPECLHEFSLFASRKAAAVFY
jgi:hypothetical protein